MSNGSNTLRRPVKGFSLVELLVVMVIIGLLGAVVAPMVYQHLSPAKHTAVRSQFDGFATALDSFFIDVGRYPRNDEGLAALWQSPGGVSGWKGPYLKRAVPLDPWGNKYVYNSPASNGPYEIISLGEDGQVGGEEEARDIVSWQTD